MDGSAVTSGSSLSLTTRSASAASGSPACRLLIDQALAPFMSVAAAS